jgi:hypothetical protein
MTDVRYRMTDVRYRADAEASGEGHVVSYDDSNVVIGGQGGVNAPDR